MTTTPSKTSAKPTQSDRPYDGGVGVCRAGIRFCNGDASSECIGQVTPGVEVCNGQDDDCDGVDDEELPEVTCGIGACIATAGCNAGDPGRCTPGEPSTEQCNDIAKEEALPPPGTAIPRWVFEQWVSKDISNRDDTYAFIDGFRERGSPVGAVVLDSPW